MTRVLVTGINGFTGKYLEGLLNSSGYDVYGTCYSKPINTEKHYQCDITNKTAIYDIVREVKPDLVVHLAAVSFAAHTDPAVVYVTNIVGTRNLLEALCQTKCRTSRILLASTAQVYGMVSHGQPITENDRLAPHNDYAVSKLAMEKIAEIWSSKLPIIISRPFNYIGVGQAEHFLVPKIIQHFVERRSSIELGNVNISRDFTDVRLVVKAYQHLLEDKNTNMSELFNVCSGYATSIQDIINFLEKISGHTIEVKINPKYVRENDPKILVGCNKKIIKNTGVNMLEYSVYDTLRWCYEAASGGLLSG